jgi:hypothetical protein
VHSDLDENIVRLDVAQDIGIEYLSVAEGAAEMPISGILWGTQLWPFLPVQGVV